MAMPWEGEGVSDDALAQMFQRDPLRAIRNGYNPMNPKWGYGAGGGEVPMTHGIPRGAPYGNQSPLAPQGGRGTTLGSTPGSYVDNGAGYDPADVPMTPDDIMTPGRQNIPNFKSMSPRSGPGPYTDAQFRTPGNGPESFRTAGGGGMGYGGGPATGGGSASPVQGALARTPGQIDPAALGGEGSGVWSILSRILGGNPIIRGGVLAMQPTPLANDSAPTNMWNQRPSGVGPTDPLDPHSAAAAPAAAPPLPPVRPASAAPSVPLPPVRPRAASPQAMPNLGYYQAETGNARGTHYVPNMAADDPRRYRGPLSMGGI